MILMLCGTSDARELAVQIQQQGMDVLTSVVTESAAHSLSEGAAGSNRQADDRSHGPACP